MYSNEETKIDPQKKAVYSSYLNYMMIPESSVYDYQIQETREHELKEESEEIEEA